MQNKKGPETAEVFRVFSKLKEKIEKCVYDSEMRYSGGWGAAPAILSCIKVEDIGTIS